MMTTIKQVAVTTPGHVANLSRYLDDDRVLARESRLIIDEGKWSEQMNATRESFGHNKPGKVGAKCTYGYHQIIAFNPDEIDLNGGKLSEEDCMAYAREWVQARYPNNEAIWVLHCEHCRADNTERYAVHIAVNRSDTETGKRLCEGRSSQAKIERANMIRDMDRARGLREVVANERNSRVHARQPTKAEREMQARGVKSEKQFIRERVRDEVKALQQHPQQNNVRALSQALDRDGITMTQNANKKDFQFQRNGVKVNGNKLGRGFSRGGLVRALGMTAARELANAVEQDMER